MTNNKPKSTCPGVSSTWDFFWHHFSAWYKKDSNALFSGVCILGNWPESFFSFVFVLSSRWSCFYSFLGRPSHLDDSISIDFNFHNYVRNSAKRAGKWWDSGSGAWKSAFFFCLFLMNDPGIFWLFWHILYIFRHPVVLILFIFSCLFCLVFLACSLFSFFWFLVHAHSILPLVFWYI